MKYFSASIQVEARTEIEAVAILKEWIKDNTLYDCSMHCTDHDPSVPTLFISSGEKEDNNMHDCTDRFASIV